MKEMSLVLLYCTIQTNAKHQNQNIYAEKLLSEGVIDAGLVKNLKYKDRS
jgi:hypothetical protein